MKNRFLLAVVPGGLAPEGSTEAFAREVLKRTPPDGAAVPYREVARWIESRRPGLPPGLLPGER